MSLDDSVPILDLAPKLKRPLSLWKPLDYLRLLYWAFFFPQAVSWYDKKFGDGTDFSDENTWKERWQWLKKNTIQQRLIFQSLLILLIVNFGVMQALSLLGITIKWFSLYQHASRNYALSVQGFSCYTPAILNGGKMQG
jgi:hypothetical protein